MPDSNFTAVKSASRRKTFKGKFRRSTRRGGAVRVPAAGDWPYLWAAYRTGAFDALMADLGDMGLETQDLTLEGFKAVMAEFMSQPGTAFWLLEAPNRGEIRPVGLVGANVQSHRVEPHVIWFKWATHRNKVEASLRFLDELGKVSLVMVFADESSRRFFNHMKKYGVLKKQGTIPHYLAPGKPADIWVSTREFARG